MTFSKLHHIENRQSAAHVLQSKISVEALEATQKLVLKSCGIQHAYLHVPLAAFEDSGFFCVLYSLTDKVIYLLFQFCPGSQLPARRSFNVTLCKTAAMSTRAQVVMTLLLL